MSTLLIYTGGTTGMVKNDAGSLVPFSLNGLLANCPDLADRINQEAVECVSLLPIKDSSNFTPDDWLSLRTLIIEHHQSHDDVLILHGTDTMAYTSSAMSFLMHDFNKNIVFTGSQLPLVANKSDGKDNLNGAFLLLDELKSKKIKGETLLSFGGKNFLGNRVSKLSTKTFDAFHGDEFSFEHEKLKPSITLPNVINLQYIETDVVLIKMHPGIQLKRLIINLLDNPPKGILLESFGTGNIPQNDAFINGIEKLLARGVIVLNISQCLDGCVNMEAYQTGIQLYELGVINGKDMTTEAALSKLMLVLSASCENKHELLANSIAGDITK